MILSPTALEAAPKATYDVPLSDGDPFGTLVYMSDYVHPGSLDDMRRSTMEILNTVATAAITAYLSQREKEGFVMVPVDRISAIWKEAEDCVPTNWCDGLLTGPKASRVPLDCPAVERLLLGIIKRIRDKAAAAQNGGE